MKGERLTKREREMQRVLGEVFANLTPKWALRWLLTDHKDDPRVGAIAFSAGIWKGASMHRHCETNDPLAKAAWERLQKLSIEIGATFDDDDEEEGGGEELPAPADARPS
jgi:hypothetical protein